MPCGPDVVDGLPTSLDGTNVRPDTDVVLCKTPQDRLSDARGRPYFLWDVDMTVEELRALLVSEDRPTRAYWLGKIMRQAKPDDVFSFASLPDIGALWPDIQRYLGHTRDFWTWLLTRWGVIDG